MQTHANCFPEAAETSGGRTTGSPATRPRSGAPTIDVASTSCPERRRGLETRESALRHGGLRRSARRPPRPPPTCAPASPSGRKACIASSNASRAPACARRFVDGVCTHAITTRSQETFCPDVAPGRPTETAVTRRRPCAERIVEPGDHGEPLRPAALGAEIDDGHLGAGVLQGPGGRVAGVVAGEDHRAPPGEHAVAVEQQVHPRRHHDARKIVAGEDRGLLDRARREDHVSSRGSDTGRRARRPPPACRRRPRTPPSPPGSERPDPSVCRASPDRRVPLASPSRWPPASRPCSSRTTDRSGLRGLGRGREAGGPGADHEDIGMEVDPPPAPVIGLVGHRAEPGLRPDERLDERPRPARALEDLVVEARRHHERERVQPSVDVPIGGGPRVLALDPHPVPHGLGAGADVRDPVDLHQAVRARAGHARAARAAGGT